MVFIDRGADDDVTPGDIYTIYRMNRAAACRRSCSASSRCSRCTRAARWPRSSSRATRSTSATGSSRSEAPVGRALHAVLRAASLWYSRHLPLFPRTGRLADQTLNGRLYQIVDELVRRGVTLEQARREFERQFIVASLQVEPRATSAAPPARLGVHRNTLRNKVTDLGIGREDYDLPRRRRAAGRRACDAAARLVYAPPAGTDFALLFGVRTFPSVTHEVSAVRVPPRALGRAA